MHALPLSDLEKAIAAAKAQGLTRYRVIKRGREIVIEVDEEMAKHEDLDAAAAIERAMGR